MAVSKLALGMNARNYLYIRPNNKPTAKKRADNKLLTKKQLVRRGIPTPQLIASFRTLQDVREYDWSSLRGSFVLKPAKGYGGSGIMVVRNWNGSTGSLLGGKTITLEVLETEIFSILDGAYSFNNLSDVALLEERVIVAGSMRKLAAKGVPDIRVIVTHKVPVMAMLRLPTVESGGRANLHQGALGIGIDIRTGITTKAVLYGEEAMVIPDTKTKVRGIKIPKWNKVLEYAVRTQEASGLGFAGVDIVLDENRGPLVLEVNARPGLQIQLANGASLRTRLERIEDMNIPSIEHGIELAKKLFAESALNQIPENDNVLGIVERVTLIGPNKKKVVEAKIDTGAFRTAIDNSLVEELELQAREGTVEVRSGSGQQMRKTTRVTFTLRGKKIQTVASYTDRAHLRFPMIIGRRDLKGFLVDPARVSDHVD